MTTTPLSQPSSSPEVEQGYFNRPSTRVDIVKFLIPLTLMFIGFLLTLYISSQRQAEALTQVQSTVAKFQEAKESRGERLIVVETQLRAQGEDLKEIKADIKTLLQRGR